MDRRILRCSRHELLEGFNKDGNCSNEAFTLLFFFIFFLLGLTGCGVKVEEKSELRRSPPRKIDVGERLNSYLWILLGLGNL